MKKVFLTLVAFFLFTLGGWSQQPKLVVGIVVDQMRPDYLVRYKKHFTEGGFNRFLNEGAVCKNVKYNYKQTYTGPGHASIYTGSTPMHHGIIANNWFDKVLSESVYCVQDDSTQTVGSTTDYGKMAPTRMLATTITDQLRIQSQFRSKVVGVALKDRGSILPAGHQPTGSYWYDKQTGQFITSSYYTKQLPKWVSDFNRRGNANDYLNKTWDFFLDEDAYTESEEDIQPYEAIFGGKKTASFPYQLRKLRKENGNFRLLPSTPFGNSITTDFALAALEGEEMGQGEHMDFLALSYSSTDYIGHSFGPQSKEIEDCYIRLDRELKLLFDYLDKEVGVGEYLVFLTADHAVAEPVGFMKKHQMPAGGYMGKSIMTKVDIELLTVFETDELVSSFSNEQVFLNHAKIKALDLDVEDVSDLVAATIKAHDGVVEVFTQEELMENTSEDPIVAALQNGIHPKRSGDLIVLFEPGWMPKLSYASTHGTSYNYDAHVPLLWYGNGIKKQHIYKAYSITDIAYTLSMMLDITLPNAANGQAILELLK